MTERLENLIHHITTLCDPDQLGHTRLAKILWLSDVEFYRLSGKTVSGSDDYCKDEFGPRHRKFYDVLEHLEKSGCVARQYSPTPAGTRHELVPLTKPDLSKFSAEEIAIVDRITALVIRRSAKKVSNDTHDELWETAYHGERMPVAAAAPISGELTPEIEKWATESLDADCAPA